MKQKLFAFALLPAVALVAAGATVATQVSAQGEGRFAPKQELIERLGLNETEVAEALAEIKEERKAQAEARYEERLLEAVAEGELTEAQKQLILDKRAELKAEMESKKAELQAWSEENGIDLKYLRLGHKGFRGHGGFHKDFKAFKDQNDD